MFCAILLVPTQPDTFAILVSRACGREQSDSFPTQVEPHDGQRPESTATTHRALPLRTVAPIAFPRSGTQNNHRVVDCRAEGRKAIGVAAAKRGTLPSPRGYSITLSSRFVTLRPQRISHGGEVRGSVQESADCS
jgi:hypothetical protein